VQSSHVLVGSRTFAYQHGHIILGILMSSASLSLEFDTIVAQERDSFSKDMDAYARDGSLPQECVFTELSRRMTIIRNVSQCPHVYNGWKNISALVETWSDRDMWELCVKKEKSELALLASRTTGGTCNVCSRFNVSEQRNTWYAKCHSIVNRVRSGITPCEPVCGVCFRGEASRWSVAKGLSARATML
jgi:hypothetical protein